MTTTTTECVALFEECPTEDPYYRLESDGYHIYETYEYFNNLFGIFSILLAVSPIAFFLYPTYAQRTVAEREMI